MIKTAHHRNGTTRKVHLGGWKKQHVDPRDEEYRIKLHPSVLVSAVPPSGSNLSICSPVEDQGDLGSCTANAFAGVIEANERRGHTQKFARAAAAPLVVVSGITANADGSVIYTTRVSPGSSPAPTPTPAPPPAAFIDASRLFHYYATRKIEGTTTEDSGATIRDTAKAGNQHGVCDEKLWAWL